jgi:hypothetical protein
MPCDLFRGGFGRGRRGFCDMAQGLAVAWQRVTPLVAALQANLLLLAMRQLA